MKKGNIIHGLFSIKNIENDHYMYASCICNGNCNKNNREYIFHYEIYNYKILLFDYYMNNEIIDMINVTESISNDKANNINLTLLHKEISNYDVLVINQKKLSYFLSNGHFQLLYKQGIKINSKIIPIFLLPKENDLSFLIKFDDNDKLLSYKIIK